MVLTAQAMHPDEPCAPNVVELHVPSTRAEPSQFTLQPRPQHPSSSRSSPAAPAAATASSVCGRIISAAVSAVSGKSEVASSEPPIIVSRNASLKS